MKLLFEWDEDKATSNLRRHRVSFEEAKTIFDDPLLATFPDPDHSAAEQRYISIGSSTSWRVLVVIHTDRDDAIRFISCRKATASERRFYEEVKDK